MAGTGSTFANDLLKLLFQATPIANIADNAASGPLTNLYFSLLTADPTAAGNQLTNQCVYTGYTRMAVVRSAGGFIITGNIVKPAADVVFPVCSAGSEIATHYGIGTDFSGAGKLLYFGPLSPTISISNTVIPRIRGTSSLTMN